MGTNQKKKKKGTFKKEKQVIEESDLHVIGD